jgi:hypothetical protein
MGLESAGRRILTITAASGSPPNPCGFGYANFVNGAGATPRSGQIVARIQF